MKVLNWHVSIDGGVILLSPLLHPHLWNLLCQWDEAGYKTPAQGTSVLLRQPATASLPRAAQGDPPFISAGQAAASPTEEDGREVRLDALCALPGHHGPSVYPGRVQGGVAEAAGAL